MKRRKRMGFPRPRITGSHGTDEAMEQSVQDDLTELMRDVLEEQQFAARQQRVRNAVVNDLRESTPEKVVAVLNRMAEAEGVFRPRQRGTAGKPDV